ncbi:MAG TPA: hypothetical protein DDZ19_05990 [Flavobacteriales bacterium]|nr:hypothetical protein [Flavobacteriales bacterium]
MCRQLLHFKAKYFPQVDQAFKRAFSVSSKPVVIADDDGCRSDSLGENFTDIFQRSHPRKFFGKRLNDQVVQPSVGEQQFFFFRRVE